MARSSSADPSTKFRFQVLVLDNVPGLFSPGSANIANKDRGLTPVGFTEVTLPKAVVKEIMYRENTNGNSPIKMPGLVTHEPVTLRKGSDKTQQMYNWYQMVNNDAATINKYQQALAGFSALPYQEPNYRREVLISQMDRTGAFVKHWLLYNAWPKEYKGGDTLDAKAEDILIEETTLAYEFFLELQGATVAAALQNAIDQGKRQAEKAAAAAAISAASGFINNLF